MKKPKFKCVADYILLSPDKPEAGGFKVDNFIDETATVTEVGPGARSDTKALLGKRVVFNAWACDQKTIGGEKYYFVPESADAICAVVS